MSTSQIHRGASHTIRPGHVVDQVFAPPSVQTEALEDGSSCGRRFPSARSRQAPASGCANGLRGPRIASFSRRGVLMATG